MDHEDALDEEESVLKGQDNEQYDGDQLYQSFSPFDLSEILSREAEMIERHYGQSHGWRLFGEEERFPLRKKHYVKKRASN